MRYYIFSSTQCFFFWFITRNCILVLHDRYRCFSTYILYHTYIGLDSYLCERTTCFLDVAIRALPTSAAMYVVNLIGESLLTFPFPGAGLLHFRSAVCLLLGGLCYGFPHAYHVFRWRCHLMFNQSGLITRC